MAVNEYTAPAHWACYLINGDATGYGDAELAAIEAFEATLGGGVVDCTSPEDDAHPGFLTWHDARDVYPYAANCAIFYTLES